VGYSGDSFYRFMTLHEKGDELVVQEVSRLSPLQTFKDANLGKA
jgi:hypothetical protein